MVSIVAGNPYCARSLSCQLFCPHCTCVWLTFAGVVGAFNPDVTFCQRSSVGTEVMSTFAEPGLERIGDLEICLRPFGARPWREGLGGTF